MPEYISSRKNEIVRQAAALAGSAALRRENGAYLCEGARLCEDAARSGVEIQRLFYTEKAAEKYSRYLNACLAAAREVYEIPDPVAALLSETKNTQGIFAVCRMERDTHALSALSGKGRLLAVENMQDPANLGAVLRTAEALGIAGVLLVGECCDIYSPKVLRASMGAVFRLPFYEAEDITVALAALHALGYTAYAAVPDAAARPIHTCCFTEGSAVFIGNEGNGLMEAARLGCDVPVTIPMQGRAESLNAAAAASIVMWELCRPRED